jgi:hypothetical protein
MEVFLSNANGSKILSIFISRNVHHFLLTMKCRSINRKRLFLFLTLVLPFLFAFQPQEAKVNQRKIEKEHKRNDKNAEKEYLKAKKNNQKKLKR